MMGRAKALRGTGELFSHTSQTALWIQKEFPHAWTTLFSSMNDREIGVCVAGFAGWGCGP